MVDISICSTKVRGRPKGRPGNVFYKPKNKDIIYPKPFPYSYMHMLKLGLWRANLIARFGEDVKIIY